jgi:hypothetical protein
MIKKATKKIDAYIAEQQNNESITIKHRSQSGTSTLVDMVVQQLDESRASPKKRQSDGFNSKSSPTSKGKEYGESRMSKSFSSNNLNTSTSTRSPHQSSETNQSVIRDMENLIARLQIQRAERRTKFE